MQCRVLAVLAASFMFTTHAYAQNQVAHAPDGGAYQRIMSILIPPKPNAPFTATVTTHWTRSNADGSKIVVQNRRAIIRDGAGRILQERRTFVPINGGSESKVFSFDIEDPTMHQRYSCNPYRKSCELSGYDVSAEPVEGNEKTAQTTTVQDLGTSSIGGLEVVGSRETRTIKAGTIGNDRDIAVSKEFWYSSQLGVNLRVKRDDPRFGVQDFEVGDIKLGEPDAKMFEVPAGYRVIDLRKPAHSATQ